MRDAGRIKKSKENRHDYLLSLLYLLYLLLLCSSSQYILCITNGTVTQSYHVL